MGKQTKSRKPENVGKGKVTPVQVAFIVDQYLSDNNYTQTRSTFRTEASDLISRSPIQQAPKSLLSLGAMLDEYICLKEQRVMLDQERCYLEQEKFRVKTLLRGMQDVMNVYNSGGTAAPLPPMVSSAVAKSAAIVPQIDPTIGSPAVYPVYTTPVVMSTTRSSNAPTDPTNFSTPITSHQTSKRRKGSKDVSEAPVTAKRSRSHSSNIQLQAKGTVTLPQPSNNNQETALQHSAVQATPCVNVPNVSPVQGSSVAKCLFNQPCQSPPINSSCPKTPPRETSSQADKAVSPLEILTANSSNNVTPQPITSTNYTVIASETIRVSPVKQITYYSIERNHCISSSPIKTNFKRLSKSDHIKGRLDFDGSDMAMKFEKPIPHGISASESEKEGDIFDLDLPNLDAFGMDFSSLSELMLDFDLDGEGINYSCQPAMDSSPDSLSGSPHTSWNVNMGANEVMSEISSTVTEILSEKDMNISGRDSVTTLKSTTKCVKILSPVKNHRSSSPDQENILTRN